MEGDHEGEHDAHQEEGDARVELGHVSQRDGQALGHQLAARATGVGPAPVVAVPAARDDGDQHHQPRPSRRTGLGTRRVPLPVS